MMHLFKIAIGTSVDTDFNCQDKSHRHSSVLSLVSPSLTIAWLIVSVVLFMNMLIASTSSPKHVLAACLSCPTLSPLRPRASQ